MSEDEKISKNDAEKKRLLEALQQLHKEGVRILDDETGRPRIIPVIKDAPETPRAPLSALQTMIESMLEIEDQNGTDPYNNNI